MIFYQIYSNSATKNFSYLIGSEDNHFYIIDPYSADDVIDRLRHHSGELKGIINTHGHDDHTLGNKKLIEKYGCKVFIDANCLENEIINIGSKIKLKVIKTPGHTMDSISLLLYMKDVPYALFTGDTVFNCGVGNCYNGGRASELYSSIKKLMAFEDNILIYPGHDYKEINLKFAENLGLIVSESLNDKNIWSLRDEKEINPFMNLMNADIIASIRKNFPTESRQLDERGLFILLRKLRDRG